MPLEIFCLMALAALGMTIVKGAALCFGPDFHPGPLTA